MNMTQMLEKIARLTEKVEDWSRLPAAPLVSVHMITYNHEKFIAQALDGILMQEVDFPYEIVIGEDKSTDRTREIVCDYQRRHPDKIRLHLSRENLYRQHLAGYGPLSAGRGKYIAVCEGDDYWTDPKKLQKQVAWLEQHPESSFCFHPCKVEQEGGGVVSGPAETPTAETGKAVDFEDSKALLMWCIVHTVSAMIRAKMLPDFNKGWTSLPVGDWPIFFHLGMQGPFACLPDTMAVYRQHAGGIWSSLALPQQKNTILDVYRGIREMGMAAYPDEFRQADVNQLRDYLDDLFWDPKMKQDLHQLLDQGIDRIQSPFFSSRKLSRLALEALYYKTWWAGRREHARAVLAELVARHPAALLNRHWLRAGLACLFGRSG